MKYIQHPEWSKDYPAIDGISKSKRHKLDPLISNEPTILHPENPIRSDVEEILNFDEQIFMIWYQTAKEAAEKMLRQYRPIANIPDLSDGSEKLKLYIGSSITINPIIQDLKRGLEYLEIIKQAKEEILGKKLEEFKNEF